MSYIPGWPDTEFTVVPGTYYFPYDVKPRAKIKKVRVCVEKPDGTKYCIEMEYEESKPVSVRHDIVWCGYSYEYQ